MMPSKIMENMLLFGAVPAPFVIVWVLAKLTGPVDIHLAAAIMCLPIVMLLLAGEINFARRKYNRNKHR